MGPSHPPFCKPGISSVAAASALAIWKRLAAASLVMTEAWRFATEEAAASKAGNSEVMDALTATPRAGVTRRVVRGAARRSGRRPPARRAWEVVTTQPEAAALTGAKAPHATCIVSCFVPVVRGFPAYSLSLSLSLSPVSRAEDFGGERDGVSRDARS